MILNYVSDEFFVFRSGKRNLMYLSCLRSCVLFLGRPRRLSQEEMKEVDDLVTTRINGIRVTTFSCFVNSFPDFFWDLTGKKMRCSSLSQDTAGEMPLLLFPPGLTKIPFVSGGQREPTIPKPLPSHPKIRSWVSTASVWRKKGLSHQNRNLIPSNPVPHPIFQKFKMSPCDFQNATQGLEKNLPLKEPKKITF